MKKIAPRFFLVFLGQDYKHLKHSYDIWHGAKNLAKKISKVCHVNLRSFLKKKVTY